MKTMKPLLLSIAFSTTILSLVSMSGCNQDTTSENKSSSAASSATIGVSNANLLQGLSIVDRTVVFSKSNAGQEGREYLKDVAASLDKEFNAYKAQVNGTDQATQEKIQKKFAFLRARYKAEENQVNRALEQLYQGSLGTVMTTEKIQVVFDRSATQAYRNPLDISEKIIAVMNKTTLKFTPLPAPPVSPISKEETKNTQTSDKESAKSGANDNKKSSSTQKNNKR